MTGLAIQVENVSKSFRIGMAQQRYVALRDRLMSAITAPSPAALQRGERIRARNRIFWALRDVSFEVAHGEVVGIVGRNGAGKSTLLKILSRISEPTSGRAILNGRVSSLLEVGSGFHPELSGRDNIYMNGAILGMRRQEIRQKFDEIVAFAETEQFVDTPIKHYSSGMYMRLAFAVAAHLEAQTLFVDEVLAVGDAGFQKKCLGKMQSIVNEGRTVVFVSHNLTAIATLCKKTLHLDAGKVAAYGPTEEVVSRYLAPEDTACAFDRRLFPNEPQFELVDAHITQQGCARPPFLTSRPVDVEIAYRIKTDVVGLRVGFDVLTHDGIVLWRSWDDDMNGEGATVRAAGSYRAICRIPANIFFPRSYVVSLSAGVQHTRWITVGTVQQTIQFYNSGGVGWAYADEQHRAGLLMPALPWVTCPLDRTSYLQPPAALSEVRR